MNDLSVKYLIKYWFSKSSCVWVQTLNILGALYCCAVVFKQRLLDRDRSIFILFFCEITNLFSIFENNLKMSEC